MGEKFPIDTAQIVGLFMEAVAYGIYLPTFFLCTHALLRADGQWKRWKELSYLMVLATFAMFVFATMDVAFGLRNNILAFVIMEERGDDPEKTFDDISIWTNVMKMVDYVGMTFVGDAILVYRCFIIWERRWYMVALPALLYVGETACGIMTIYFETVADDGGLNQSTLKPSIASMLSLNLATSIITTGLIVGRIWQVQHNASGFIRNPVLGKNKDPMSRAIRAMIESGSIYTLSIVILFVVYVIGHNALLGVSDTVTQIIGINFNLIIINTARVRKELSTGQGPLSGNANAGAIGTGGSMPMHMISIQTEISRQRDPIEFIRSNKDDDAEMGSRSPSLTASELPSAPRRPQSGRAPSVKNGAYGKKYGW